MLVVAVLKHVWPRSGYFEEKCFLLHVFDNTQDHNVLDVNSSKKTGLGIAVNERNTTGMNYDCKSCLFPNTKIMCFSD